MSKQSSGGRADAILARSSLRPRRASQASKRPRTGVAVLTCMDARLDVHRILALEEGDAHIIRNAGGVVTEDVLLALVVSQRLLETREILVMHHHDCAAGTMDADELAAAVERDTGHRPPWRFEARPDAALRVWEAVRALSVTPYLAHTELVRGVLYDERADDLSVVCEVAFPARSVTALRHGPHELAIGPLTDMWQPITSAPEPRRYEPKEKMQ
jgi:carbonic anhydrase